MCRWLKCYYSYLPKCGKNWNWILSENKNNVLENASQWIRPEKKLFLPVSKAHIFAITHNIFGVIYWDTYISNILNCMYKT